MCRTLKTMVVTVQRETQEKFQRRWSLGVRPLGVESFSRKSDSAQVLPNGGERMQSVDPVSEEVAELELRFGFCGRSLSHIRMIL